MIHVGTKQELSLQPGYGRGPYFSPNTVILICLQVSTASVEHSFLKILPLYKKIF